VVNYHGVSSHYLNAFKLQLSYLKNAYCIISPSEIDLYFEKKLTSEKPFLLLTFDDGLSNQLEVAKYLHQQNIQTYFFIIPTFINTEKTHQKAYYRENIRSQTNSFMEKEDADYNALSWDDVKEILSMGHSIGAHSSSHAMLANEKDIAKVYFEIVECKAQIVFAMQPQSIKINSFCSIINTANSVGKKEAQVIAQNYKYHFSTFPGSNTQRNKQLIRRCNVEAHFSEGEVKFSMGKFNRVLWNKKVANFNSSIV